ncbi:MAG: ATP-binding cassette domain-containing protein [Acidimicrobiia bacterium]
MSGTLLSVTDLRVRYASVEALFGVSIEVPEGSVTAVLGANGAGKSTLARAVSGLVPVESGRIEFGGEDTTNWPDPPDPARRTRAHPGGAACSPASPCRRTSGWRSGGWARTGGARRRSPGRSSCSPCSPTVGRSAQDRCRAVSSRCWRSRGAGGAAATRRRRRDVARAGAARRRLRLREPGGGGAQRQAVVLIEQFVHRTGPGHQRGDPEAGRGRLGRSGRGCRAGGARPLPGRGGRA